MASDCKSMLAERALCSGVRLAAQSEHPAKLIAMVRVLITFVMRVPFEGWVVTRDQTSLSPWRSASSRSSYASWTS